MQLIHERLDIDSGSDRETINGLLEDYFSAPGDTPRMTTLENSVVHLAVMAQIITVASTLSFSTALKTPNDFSFQN